MCAEVTNEHPPDDEDAHFTPLVTGSVAEFYIEPMLPHIGDIDVMIHPSNDLAIPQGHPPPTQLPAEFSKSVLVYEIEESEEFPAYVYLKRRYLLTRCTDGETYTYADYKHQQYLLNRDYANAGDGSDIHGPAILAQFVGKFHTDVVHCVRCLSWPPQAADWPTRHRNYNWPDSATVGHIVNNGCDLVGVAHRQCRENEVKGQLQFRLSFSRAEIVLMNSWMPVQQIVYHMLRVFVKTERLIDSSDNSEAFKLSNYHIKTLMLWASELRPSSFWTDDQNLIKICVELLQSLSVSLTDAQCNHYFVNGCKLIDNSLEVEMIAKRLKSINEAWLSAWFVNNYIHMCSMLCSDNISTLFNDVIMNTELQKAVSQVVNWRQNNAVEKMWHELHAAEFNILYYRRVTVRSCIYSMRELSKMHTCLTVYFTAVTLLHIAYRISSSGFTNELMDVLTTIAGQSASAGHHHSQCSSDLSLSKAIKLMKIVANSSCSSHQSSVSGIDLKTSELVALLQQSAVEHLTTYRQLELQDFGSVATIVTSDFEALYAYKRGDYQQCLELSKQNVRMLLNAFPMSIIPIFPEFIQLMDDEIVSLISMTRIVNPELVDDTPRKNSITQLTLSLYLTSQCQLKLDQMTPLMAQTIRDIEASQRLCPDHRLMDHLILKLTKQKLFTYLNCTIVYI